MREVSEWVLPPDIESIPKPPSDSRVGNADGCPYGPLGELWRFMQCSLQGLLKAKDTNIINTMMMPLSVFRVGDAQHVDGLNQHVVNRFKVVCGV